MQTRTWNPAAAFAVVPLVALLAAAPTARGQALADRVPQDAILYIGWNGAGQMGPGYEGSNLKGVLDASDFPKLFDQFLPQLMQKIGQEERDAQEVMNLVSGLAKPMWKHPTAFFFAGVEFPPPGQDNQPPMPKLGLICKAGADADDLHKRIQGLLDMRETPGEVRQFVKAAKVGDSVVVTVGIAPDALPGGNGGGAGNALSGNQTFRGALSAAGGKVSPVGVLYVDAEKLQAMIDQGLNRYAGPNEKGMWAKVQANLGLKGIKRLTCVSGFDGKDWQDNLFLEAPAPRSGILSLFGETPLSDDALKVIPSTATMAGAGKFDANRFLTGLRDLAAGFDPNAAREFDKAMAEASRAIGMDVQKDVLANFGDEWVYYADPNIGGRGMLGFCLINRLKDAEKAEQALVKLQDLVAREINKEMNRGGGGGPQPRLSFYTTKHGDTTIHYVGTPLVTPSWAVKNGNLYFGLFPQVIAAAAAHEPDSGKSILDNPDFKALRQRLGAQKPTSVAFMDLPKTAPDAYAQWVMISRLVGFGDMLGVQSPAMLLPPLPKLMQHLSPAGSAAWVDKDGWHMRSITPFPGSTILASDPTASMLGFAPLLAGIAMPAMSKARHAARGADAGESARPEAAPPDRRPTPPRINPPPTPPRPTPPAPRPPRAPQPPR